MRDRRRSTARRRERSVDGALQSWERLFVGVTVRHIFEDASQLIRRFPLVEKDSVVFARVDNALKQRIRGEGRIREGKEGLQCKERESVGW